MGWKPSCISPKHPIKKLASQILITLSVCRCSRKNSDFRSFTLIRYKLGKAVTNIHQGLTITFPESCPTLRTIQRWDSEIQSGTFTLEKGISSGRSLETMTPENIACVKELIEQNPRMSTREPAADLSLPHTAVYEILKKDLMSFIVHVQFFVSYRFLSLIVILLYKQSTAVERSFYNFIVNLLFTYFALVYTDCTP